MNEDLKYGRQVDYNIASAYLRELPPDKRRPAARLLQLYVGDTATLDEFDWGSVSRLALVDARSRLANRYSPSTVNSVLSRVRAVLQYGLRAGLLPARLYLDSLEVPGMDRKQATSPLEVAPADLASLFGACGDDPQPAGRRDAFLFLLMACAGFDRREIVALSNLHAPEPHESGLFAAEIAHQRESRTLVLAERGRDIVAAWISARGCVPGPAVCSISQDGAVLATEPVHEQLTYRILKKRAKEAGIRRISTTALKWYYRLHLPGQMRRADFLIPTKVRHVLEPPE